MNSKKRDPLLAIAQALVLLGIAFEIFVLAMLVIGLAVLLTARRGEVMARLAEAGAPDGTYWAIVLAVLLVGALLSVGLRFFFELRGIGRSVDRGDPFEPANAARLSRMGWLVVAAHVLAITLDALVAWVRSVAGEAASGLDLDFDLGGGGFLLILVLFILARVFRQGAAMRADLEGTV